MVFTSFLNPAEMLNNAYQGVMYALSGAGVEYGVTTTAAGMAVGAIEGALAPSVVGVVGAGITSFLIRSFNAAFSWGLSSQYPVVSGTSSGARLAPLSGAGTGSPPFPY